MKLIKNKEQFSKKNKEIISYIFVGFGAICIDYFCFQSYHHYLGFNALHAKRLSYITGGIWVFLLNKKITFQSNRKSLVEPFLFIALYVFSFWINSISYDYCHQYFSNDRSFFVATMCSIVINYLGQKFVVFQSK